MTAIGVTERIMEIIDRPAREGLLVAQFPINGILGI
jgi:hypothetical protein